MEQFMEIISKIFFSKFLVLIAVVAILMLFLKKYKDFQNYKENIETDIIKHEKEDNIKEEQPKEEKDEEKVEETIETEIEEDIEK